MLRLLILLSALLTAPANVPPRPSPEIAITFDDLPVVSTVWKDLATHTRVTTELIDAIQRHHIPAIGFVNENKLEAEGRVEEARVALLERWLQAGLELGNHTYSHLDLHQAALADYEADVLRGETVTRRLLAGRGLKPRFFRHPFLHTGRDLQTRRSFETFLAAHGYRVAPVTLDNSDYVFAAAYDRAVLRGDEAGQARIRSAYLDYMSHVVEYYEEQSRAILGRNLRQILLLHANALNARELDGLARRLEARGYAFITLERALEDPAYGSADEYVGPGGITWLHRWALTQGKRGDFFKGEPEVPAWVEQASRDEPPPQPFPRASASASQPRRSLSSGMFER